MRHHLRSPRPVARLLAPFSVGLLLLLSGCDDGGSIGQSVVCNGGLNVQGTLDRSQLEINSTVDDYALDQLSTPKTLDISDGFGTAFHFEWDELQADGQPFKVTGWMLEDDVPYCFSGELTLNDSGFDHWSASSFRVRTGDTCGASVSGRLAACSGTGQ